MRTVIVRLIMIINEIDISNNNVMVAILIAIIVRKMIVANPKTITEVENIRLMNTE